MWVAHPDRLRKQVAGCSEPKQWGRVLSKGDLAMNAFDGCDLGATAFQTQDVTVTLQRHQIGARETVEAVLERVRRFRAGQEAMPLNHLVVVVV